MRNSVKNQSRVDISVIVPSYHRPEKLTECLESLRRAETGSLAIEVIVVIDGDVDQYRNVLPGVKNVSDGLRMKSIVISHGGVSKARNAGIAEAQGSIILTIDDDCLVFPDWAENFYNFMQEHPDIVAAGGNVVGTGKEETLAEKYAAFKGLYRSPAPSPSHEVVLIHSGIGCYRKKELVSAGQFREGLDYGEDLDVSIRIRKFGKLGFCDSAKVHHYSRETVRELVKQNFNYGRGGFLACSINNFDFREIHFRQPTSWNSLMASWVIFKYTLSKIPPRLHGKHVPGRYWMPFLLIDLLRKNAFLFGAWVESHRRLEK